MQDCSRPEASCKPRFARPPQPHSKPCKVLCRPCKSPEEEDMLKGAVNEQLFAEYYDLILTPEAKAAFSYLVGWSASLKGHECFPSGHGVIKDFRFMRGDNWDFAFIPNQQWLLFYFRLPCQQLKKYSRYNILETFPRAAENNAGEYTLKVKTLSHALDVAGFIDS